MKSRCTNMHEHLFQQLILPKAFSQPYLGRSLCVLDNIATASYNAKIFYYKSLCNSELLSNPFVCNQIYINLGLTTNPYGYIEQGTDSNQIDENDVGRALRKVNKCLEDDKYSKLLSKSGHILDVYLALWASAQKYLESSFDMAMKILGGESDDTKLAVLIASHFYPSVQRAKLILKIFESKKSNDDPRIIALIVHCLKGLYGPDLISSSDVPIMYYSKSNQMLIPYKGDSTVVFTMDNLQLLAAHVRKMMHNETVIAYADKEIDIGLFSHETINYTIPLLSQNN